MIYLIIVNIILIIWLYRKYIYMPNCVDENYRELEEMDSALIGYIDNEDANSIDWILAEILELNRKDYVNIEYVKIDVDKYNYVIKRKKEKDISKLKKYELTAYRFLFDELDEVSIDYLEEKIKVSITKQRDTQVKSLSIRKEIEEELENQNIVNKNLKAIQKIMQTAYVIITLVAILVTEGKQLLTSFLLLIETIVILYILYDGRPFTKKGKELKSKVLKYKKSLDENELLKEKKIVHNMLLEKHYADAIALHIPTVAKEEFINDELQEKRVGKVMPIIRILIYIVLYIIFFKINK